MDFIDFCEEKKVIKFIAAIECVSIFFYWIFITNVHES